MLIDVYRHSHKTLRAMAARIVGAVDAEDVVHDAFIRALESRVGFRGHASEATWVAKIVVNTALNARRRTRRRHSVEAAAVAEDSHCSVQLAPPDRLFVRIAFSSLSKRDREVLLLVDVLRWTHAEVARRLNIKVGTAKWRLFEARRRLHRLVTHGSSVRVEGPSD